MQVFSNGQIIDSNNPPEQMRAYFYTDAKKVKGEYVDMPFIMLVSKGGTRKIPTPATDEHKRNYPQQWQAYLEREANPRTPLECVIRSPALRYSLGDSGIYCLEDLITENPPELENEIKAAKTVLEVMNNEKSKTCENETHNDCAGAGGRTGHQARENSASKGQSPGKTAWTPPQIEGVTFEYSLNF